MTKNRTTCRVPPTNPRVLPTSYLVRVNHPPPRSLRVRYTRRIHFRRDTRWGRTGVTSTPRVATRPDQLPIVPTTALRRVRGPPDPAPKNGGKFPPGKETQPPKQSHQTTPSLHDTRPASPFNG